MSDVSSREYERLYPESMGKKLAPSLFSSKIIYREIIDSTNDLAKQLAADGASDGTLVVAEEQTGGKGRRGRSWISPPGANLLFSLLLRPAMDGDRVFVLTMVLALAGLKAIQKVCGVKAMIKWPNDLYVGARKLAGILTEFSVNGRQVDWAVLGMGMNVGWHPDVSERSGAPATSLQEETGQRISRHDLLLEILRRFEVFYEEVVYGSTKALYDEWNHHCLILGKAVVIESDIERIEGRALRIDECGALIIEDARGNEQKIFTGEVSLRLASSS
jgi:BirA family biotin operon repressor/biotin-[acetyl-CoA-carboxylase] ligase